MKTLHLRSLILLFATIGTAQASDSVHTNFAAYGMHVEPRGMIVCDRNQPTCEERQYFVVTGIACSSPADNAGVKVNDIVVGHGHAIIEKDGGDVEEEVLQVVLVRHFQSGTTRLALRIEKKPFDTETRAIRCGIIGTPA